MRTLAAARKSGKDVPAVAAIWFASGARFGFDWLRTAASDIKPANEWEARAIGALVDDLDAAQRTLSAQAVEGTGKPEALLDAWARTREVPVGRIDALLGEMRHGGVLDLARLAIAGRAIGTLISTAA